jgi:LmbE family N-acetylglucosaminyl deacetylase
VNQEFDYQGMLDKSVIVVAHPDDEMLWFSSILARVSKIIVCMVDSQRHPELGPARKESMSRYPLPNLISLNMEQADTLGYGADWNNPVLTEYGIALPKKPDLAGRYQANYSSLRNRLQQELSACSNVFTHNPWGEYGHEEHVQVYRVVKDLQAEFNFKIWYSNYCSNRSYPLMIRQLSGGGKQMLTLKTDRKIMDMIKKLYQDFGCWTWYSDWNGFSEDTFFSENNNENSEEKHSYDSFPLNFLRMIPDEANPPLGKIDFLKKLFRLRLPLPINVRLRKRRQ